MSIQEKIECAQQDVVKTLQQYFDQPLDTAHTVKATQYGLFNGGKRLRPFLVYASGEMLGANKQDLDILAAAIECIHLSLIHI